MTLKKQKDLLEKAYRLTQKVRNDRERRGQRVSRELSDAMLQLDDSITILEAEIERES